MKKVCRNLVLSLLVICLLSGCGANRRKAKAKAMVTKYAYETKTTISVLEEKVESQQAQIDTLEKQIAELQKK